LVPGTAQSQRVTESRRQDRLGDPPTDGCCSAWLRASENHFSAGTGEAKEGLSQETLRIYSIAGQAAAQESGSMLPLTDLRHSTCVHAARRAA